MHYADTHGHDQDRPRPNAWPYRDYVIRAFNDDKPYARFVQEQLAGDVLYPDDPQAIVATGFIAAGPWDESSQMHIVDDTVDKKMAQNLDRDDMVMTTMSTFVSATVHCARCHEHKFDPISQEEYYGLQAVFAGVDRADRPYDADVKTLQRRQALLKERKALDARAEETVRAIMTAGVQAGVATWEKSLQKERNIWTVLDPATFTSASGSTLTKQADSSLLASGPPPESDTYTIVAHTDVHPITAIRLETMTDDTLPMHGPGRNPNGNFALTEIQMKASPRKNIPASQPAELHRPTADFSQKDWSVTLAVDGNATSGWSVYPEVGKIHLAVFQTKENVGFVDGTTLTFTLEQKHGEHHLIGRPRLSVTAEPRPVVAKPIPDEVKQILSVPIAQRTDQQRVDLTIFYLREKVEKKFAALPSPNMVYAAANDFRPQKNFRPATVPRPIHVLRRGDILRPQELVGPGALSCVSNVAHQFQIRDQNDEGARRAALARWITDPKNVLTWRSIVNRIWQYHFSRGIVDTPSDFGHMGSLPTHPELLDWLAFSFLESGGSIKQLHRMILTSAVYQQSCEFNADYARIDADNRYLWRMNRTRLDAESVRDAVLQITGKLDLTMGGPPVMHFHYEDPDVGRTPLVDYTRFDVDSPQSFRRSIYRYIFRTIPDPFMDTMDCPDAATLTPVRNTSMTALQAMAMFNDPFILRQCEHLAERLQKEIRTPHASAESDVAGDLTHQIQFAYELAIARPPTATEARLITAYATKYGLANACRLILNCNEFMFVN